MTHDFPTYPSNEAAAAAGCFSCKLPLYAAVVRDSGYPPGRGRYMLRCIACGMLTFYDIKDPGPSNDD